jgi:hypothetical protein
MKLFEFFGQQELDFYRSHPDDKKTDNRKEEQANLANEIFFHIIDHDKLHKKHFFDIARHVKEAHGKDDGHDPKYWMEMVKDGCVDFFHTHKMKGDIKELFNKDIRKELCQRLADHYHKDIAKDQYTLGS